MGWAFAGACVHLYAWRAGLTDSRAYDEFVEWLKEYERLWPASSLGRRILSTALNGLASRSRAQPPTCDPALDGATLDAGMLWHDPSTFAHLVDPIATGEAADELIASQWWTPWFAAAALDSCTQLNSLSS